MSCLLTGIKNMLCYGLSTRLCFSRVRFLVNVWIWNFPVYFVTFMMITSNQKVKVFEVLLKLWMVLWWIVIGAQPGVRYALHSSERRNKSLAIFKVLERINRMQIFYFQFEVHSYICWHFVCFVSTFDWVLLSFNILSLHGMQASYNLTRNDFE